MNISKRWLRDMVPGLTADTAEIAEHLALRGAPVEAIESPGAELGDIVIGRVVSASPHPNADRLSLCEVDGGDGIVGVVCGAPNVQAGTCYPFAPVGAVLPGDFKIKKAKIRGEVSRGMLCSAKELGLGTDHTGILALEGDFTPGESFVAALGLDDATLDVEITANRGDLLSHVGVARELAPYGEGHVVLPRIPDAPDLEPEYVQEADEVAVGGVSVRIDDADLCSRYLGAVIRGVAVGPSPAWLQERLRGAGARPINNVVDATNYVMLELGQPLHAFDLARLGGSAIIVRRAADSETTFTTLDDEERVLTAETLMICDGDGPVAIGGVMGGLHSEVEAETTDVLLECALFDPKSIRATRRRLGMSTDASYRYERGVDPEGMRTAIERAVALILATAGGELDGPILDCCPRPYRSTTVDLRMSRIERLLGIPFEAAYVTELLSPLGFVVEGETDGTLQVRIPGFRSYDVTREVDLIEEVARTHGYDAFPSELQPARPGTVPDHPLFRLEDELRSLLAARGLFESQTPAFVPPGEGDVEVANPLATTHPFMRQDLLPSLLRRLEYNLAHGNRNVRLFELGTSFRKAASGCPPTESPHLAAVLTGLREPPHWSYSAEPLAIWDLKALFEDVVRCAYRGALPLSPEGPDVPHLDPQASFVVRTEGGGVVGRAGRVLPDAVDTPPWAGDVWAFELTLPSDPAPPPVPVHVPLPQYPGSERDLALLVPAGVTVADVGRVISAKGGEDLESVDVFDVYEGEALGDELRSIAFRLRFRSPKRTLKDKEVDRHVASVLKRLQEDLGVRVRG
jgi:phenylalanyl-tRNA synthetase beta chain